VKPVVFLQPAFGGTVIETVAQAHHPARAGGTQRGIQTRQRLARFIGRQQGAAASGKAFRFSQMQV